MALQTRYARLEEFRKKHVGVLVIYFTEPVSNCCYEVIAASGMEKNLETSEPIESYICFIYTFRTPETRFVFTKLLDILNVFEDSERRMSKRIWGL